MTLHFASAATPEFPWAKAYWASVQKHTEGDVGMFRYFFWNSDVAIPLPPVPSEEHLAPVPANRCRTMQRGEFLQRLTIGSHRDVVMFTDADMLMQRPFAYDEMNLVLGVGENEVLVGVNGHEDDTLWHEAHLLFAHEGCDQECMDANVKALDQALPGWRELPVRNIGVIVARIETYQRLYDLSRALLPLVEGIFAHYACIQFCVCYCIGRFLRQRLLPQSIHTHGHFGLPAGAAWDADGDVCWDGVKAVFRHALNLNPPKGCEPPRHEWHQDLKQ